MPRGWSAPEIPYQIGIGGTTVIKVKQLYLVLMSNKLLADLNMCSRLGKYK